MTHNAETEVENYLLEGHSFEEFATEVARYNALIEEISYDCPKVFLIFFFSLFAFSFSCTYFTEFISRQNRQNNSLKECVFVNSAFKIQCHIVKNTFLQTALKTSVNNFRF